MAPKPQGLATPLKKYATLSEERALECVQVLHQRVEFIPQEIATQAYNYAASQPIKPLTCDSFEGKQEQ
jgi:hypothetical protein